LENVEQIYKDSVKSLCANKSWEIGRDRKKIKKTKASAVMCNRFAKMVCTICQKTHVPISGVWVRRIYIYACCFWGQEAKTVE